MKEFILKMKVEISKRLFEKFKSLLHTEDLRGVLLERNSDRNKEMLASRIQVVSEFLYDEAPDVFKDLERPVVCENGEWNYFPLPSGRKLKFEFVVTGIPLYICVLDERSASWEEARLSGIDREEWEITQADIKAIELGVPKLGTAGRPLAPKLVMLKWGDPVNYFELDKRFRDLEII